MESRKCRAVIYHLTSWHLGVLLLYFLSLLHWFFRSFHVPQKCPDRHPGTPEANLSHRSGLSGRNSLMPTIHSGWLGYVKPKSLNRTNDSWLVFPVVFNKMLNLWLSYLHLVKTSLATYFQALAVDMERSGACLHIMFPGNWLKAHQLLSDVPLYLNYVSRNMTLKKNLKPVYLKWNAFLYLKLRGKHWYRHTLLHKRSDILRCIT